MPHSRRDRERIITELIDLSQPIEDGMVTYPGLPGPRITDHLGWEESRVHYAPGTEFHIARIEMVANTGTYLDAPAHRYRNGVDLGGLPLEAVADLPGICLGADAPAIGPGAMGDHDLGGKAVLLATGWDRHWRTDRYGSPGHPHLTEEGARYLVSAGAVLVGIDSVNIDDVEDRRRPAHSLLLEAGIPIVEHLRGLGPLVGRSFRFFAVPPKVRGMGTFPVRAFAIVP